MKKYYGLQVEGKSADVYIYGDITSFPWLESDVSSYGLAKEIDDLDVDEIHVYINSYGGEVAEGLAIYNALKRHRARVTTYADGFVCSAALLPYVAGDVRVMSPASLLMAHNAWTRATGNADDLRKEADDLEKITQATITAYMTVAKVDEAEVKRIMDEETWITPEQAVTLGFATAILNPGDGARPSQSVRDKIMQTVATPRGAVTLDADQAREVARLVAQELGRAQKEIESLKKGEENALVRFARAMKEEK